jgi:sugar lactone lactonase YvrE
MGCSGDYMASVTPPPNPSTPEGLWTSSGATPAVLGLRSNQLLASGDRQPATNIFTSSAELFNLNGVAFDTDGTLWVTSQDDSQLVSFSPAALAKGGVSVATTVIHSHAGSLSSPTGLAFDSQHRLWVANSANGTIARFDREQLSAGGSPAPSVVISNNGSPIALAFDAAGSLWVSDIHKHRLEGYSPDQLAASGAPTPHVLIGISSSAFTTPAGLAFDSHGNLWVANTANQTVVSFGAAQLAASGAPVPHIVLSSNAGSLVIPSGLAFDAEGSLWVIGGGGSLEKFASASLGASGSPAPSVRIALRGFVLFWSMAFWPKPAGLPLN